MMPTLLFLVVGFFLSDVDQYKLKLSILETAFGSLIIFLLHNLLPSRKIKGLSFYLGYLFISLAVFIQISYYNLYSDRISSSTIFILLETNLSETMEYLEAYFSKLNFLILFLLLVPLLFVRQLFKFKQIDPQMKLATFAIVIVSLLIYHYKSLAKHNLYQISWNSYQEYLEQTSLYNELGLDESQGGIQEVSARKTSEKEVFVMVIGESTTRHHMSLYGYPRRTNPLLAKIRDELTIFEDVISPHTHTIPSLSKMMTFNNYEADNRMDQGTIIQLMNRAGFKTYWISNQKPIGWHESLISIMAKASDVTYFLNPKAEFKQTSFDGDLLPYFLNVLDDNAQKKFIIIHLLGTHVEYNKRYPEGFNIFAGMPPSSVTNKPENIKVINAYDNAVAYNDKVLYDFINTLRSRDHESWLLYFSDHGEDVFRINNSFGHTETKGTYPMYDVPFILWQSEKFKESSNFNLAEKRTYMLDDLIYSISDLSGLRFDGFEAERSVFNDSFLQRKRFIYDGKDYDAIIKR